MKLARRFLFVFAAVALVLGVLVTLFYLVEDWRGARAWETCRHDLLARGERLDVAAFVPPPVPDDQNLAMAPMFVRMYGYRVDPVTRVLTFPSPAISSPLRDEITAMPRGPSNESIQAPISKGDWSTGHSLDLAAWQQYYRRRPDFPHSDQPRTPAEDVLLALTKYAPILDEVAREAAARPLTRFPINWTDPQPWKIALPHYNVFQCLTATLKLRVTANLALGHTDEAMRDLTLARRLTGDSAADPLLIGQLVSVTQTGLMMQPLWEGLKSRAWSAAQLEQIKTGLRGLNYLKGYKDAIRCERATFMCETADYLKMHGDTLHLIRSIQMMQGEDQPSLMERLFGGFFNLVPGGWYDQNKALGCRIFQDDILDTFDENPRRVWLAKVHAGQDAIQQLTTTPYSILVKLGTPVYGSVLKKSASCQTGMDHALIACALEQFYLDHHACPARLEELVPSYLDQVPVDMFDGAPTRYRRTADGRYLLYSVGWNGRDDGGQIAWTNVGARRDDTQGDWVWQYQELQRPDSAPGK